MSTPPAPTLSVPKTVPPGAASPKMGVVAVLFTKPETVLEDYGRLLKLADYESALPKEFATLLKINLSWQHYYPACSTTPWQMEGVIRQLQADGYDDLIGAHNGTVVVDPFEGEVNNKHRVVEEKYGLPSITLDVAPNKWVPYEPKGRMLVLNDVYPDGLFIPETFAARDKNIIHFPTVKTHVFTQMTGALKNAFGGLLHRNRHWTHAVIHETLVDLLTIQKEIHPGIFAVMDGTFAGDGPGPRAMRWHEKNIILASADQVAIDAIAAKLMGFDPMELKKIRLAHEMGLGVGNPSEIEVVGEDVSGVNWDFAGNKSTFASRGQRLIYHGPLKPLEKALLRSPIAPWAYFASNVYHNAFWLRFIGRKRVRAAMKTGWGRLFESY
jgi:uncharacterized protein (DUF362 family)